MNHHIASEASITVNMREPGENECSRCGHPWDMKRHDTFAWLLAEARWWAETQNKWSSTFVTSFPWGPVSGFEAEDGEQAHE